MSTIVILDNIRSAQNVGAIFRTCDGAGVTKIYLTGYTPSPTDRFGRRQPAIAKTSLGATESVAWQSVTDNEVLEVVAGYQAAGYVLVAIEQSKEAISLYDFVAPKDVVYIFGNEIVGVASALMGTADHIVEIPMQGKKESLNVSVTAGIILFH